MIGFRATAATSDTERISTRTDDNLMMLSQATTLVLSETGVQLAAISPFAAELGLQIRDQQAELCIATASRPVFSAAVCCFVAVPFDCCRDGMLHACRGSPADSCAAAAGDWTAMGPQWHRYTPRRRVRGMPFARRGPLPLGPLIAMTPVADSASCCCCCCCAYGFAAA